MVHWSQSYNYGKQQEAKVLPIIIRHFNREIESNTERYAKYDFIDETYNYELKSRTNKMAQYPTTMITLNKISNDKPLILLFNYLDCLCYIEYNKELFDTFQTQMFSRAQMKFDEKEHIYIPINLLNVIETY